jgi:hypothetical protein
MLKRWAAWPPGIRWLVGSAAVVLAAGIVWALFWPLTDLLARHDVGSAKPALQTARDAARGRLLTLVAGLFAAGALVFTALNFNLSREGQVTDRYTKAIEQLGSEKLDVRIGGIYALERIARDSAKDHTTVMEVLTAFIREHSREPWPLQHAGSSRTIPRLMATQTLPSTTRTRRSAGPVRYLTRSSSSAGNPPEQERSTRPDVQAAVTVIGRRDATRDIQRIDLNHADLTGANLRNAYLGLAQVFIEGTLTGATLTGANLTRANLIVANLIGAVLDGATLTDANLSSAKLQGAFLPGANLTRATLTDAHLDHATLTDARLTSAILDHADLGGADLTGANLTGANLTGAYLAGADLVRANLTGATLTDAHLTDPALTDAVLTDVRWPTAEPIPQGWMPDGDSGRLKRAGQLSEVTAHYL